MRIKNLYKDKGQGLVEYALIVIGIALTVILVLNLTGVQINELFCRITGALGGQTCEEKAVLEAKGCSISFDDASDTESWNGKDVNSQFTFENGKMCNTGKSFNFFESCEESKIDQDFTVYLKGITIERTGTKETGVDFMFRTDDSRNGYRFSYSSSSNVIIIWKRVSNKWVMIDYSLTPQEWGNESVDFKLEVKGDTFKTYKDDELLLVVNDDTYGDGKFAWRNKPGSKSCIDEISFEEN